MSRQWSTPRVRRVSGALGAVLLVAALATGGAVLFAPSSGAATLTCPNFTDSDVPTPPAGQTGYLFIGTSVSTVTSSITVHYTVPPSPTDHSVTVAGTQQGNGAFHYIVNLPQGAVVSTATVTGATANTVVTVSGCLNGPDSTTTTTTTTTTTLAPTPRPITVSPVTVAVAPAPVAATPALTG